MSSVICPKCLQLVDLSPFCACGSDNRRVIEKAAFNGMIPFEEGLSSSDLAFLKQHRISPADKPVD